MRGFHTLAPLAAVDAAKRSATREPASAGYVNAVQIYGWSEGVLYRLYTAPEQVSDIALQPGETVISIAAGDTARWVIGDTASAAGAARRAHILVKPAAAGLRTNLIVATDRRVYHVELVSTARSPMAGIAWTYPDDLMLTLRTTAAAARDAEPVAAGIAVETLNFNYALSGDSPAWRPLRVFDDGRQVFIEFPPGLGSGEAPPLFVIGSGRQVELVNYRLRGQYYVVDRLFDAAELRIGERRQQVVRIDRRTPVARGRRGS